MAKGFAGTIFLATDDCQASYEELKGRGVEFTEKPEERPYGIDSGFRDPSGNNFRLTQVPGAGLGLAAPAKSGRPPAPPARCRSARSPPSPTAGRRGRRTSYVRVPLRGPPHHEARRRVPNTDRHLFRLRRQGAG